MKTKMIKTKKQLNILTAVLVFIFVGGLLLNAVFSYFWVYAEYDQQQELSVEIANLENELQQLMDRPIPEKVTDEQISELTKLVPVILDQSRLMLQLRELEGASGAIIEVFSAEGLRSQNDNEAESSDESFQSEQMELNVYGRTYAEVYEFMEGLQELDRVVHIRHWSMSSGVSAPAVPVVIPEEDLEDATFYNLNLHLTIYSADPYQGTFSHPDPMITLQE